MARGLLYLSPEASHVSGWSTSQRLVGLLAVAILIAASVTLVRNPAFFEPASTGSPAHGSGFCSHNQRYSYQASVEEVGTGQERQISGFYDRVPVAARGGQVVYRFQDLFATFSPAGDLLRLYREPGTTIPPILLAVPRARSSQQGKVLDFDLQIPQGGRLLRVHGQSYLSAEVQRRPDEVTRCTQSQEEDAVKAGRLESLPTS
jgi:hypothetical protein